MDGGMPVALWYIGTGKKSLTPPPVALRSGSSFQTPSEVIVVPEPINFVPPQHRTKGLEPGKSAWAKPSGTAPNCANWSGFSSPDPASPAAQHMVTPRAAAVWNAWSNEFMSCSDQFFSGLPQLIEIV